LTHYLPKVVELLQLHVFLGTSKVSDYTLAPHNRPAINPAGQVDVLSPVRDLGHLQPLRRGLADCPARTAELAEQLIAEIVARHAVQPGMVAAAWIKPAITGEKPHPPCTSLS
jgi:hypothetical protein